MHPNENSSGGSKREGFFRTLSHAEKGIVFISLVILYWLIGGFGDAWRSTDFRFVVGAVIALWLRPDPEGTLRQVSFHGIAVFFGCVLMLWAVVMTLLLRDL